MLRLLSCHSPDSHRMRFENLLGRIDSKYLLLHGIDLLAATYIWSSDDPWEQGLGEDDDHSARSIPYNFADALKARLMIESVPRLLVFYETR